MVKAKSDWWNGFDVSFRPVLDIVPAKQNNAMASYLIKKLGLRPGKRFLDCPSGPGRISIPLAKKGIRVTGVDLIQSYLDDLQRKALKRKLKVETICCDMRKIDFNSEFDAAANIWTSLGYFEKESDNLLVLRRAWQALKPGGKFMVHLVNRDWIMANFAPQHWFQSKDVHVMVENKFDYATSLMNGKWSFVKDGKITSHSFPLRIYTYHELRGMFAKAGFSDIQGFGSIEDEPISRDKRMMFVIGTKQK